MTANTLEQENPILLGDETASMTAPPPGDIRAEQASPGRLELQEFPRIPPPTQKPFQAAAWLIKATVALVFLVALLAVAATIPLVNVLVLGYLMEVQGRVARTGKLRAAFYLLPIAQRLGVMLLVSWLWLLPIQFLSQFARDSWTVAPGSVTSWLWIAVLLVTSVLIAAHLLMAIGCGGRLVQFIRPVKNVRGLLARWRSDQYWQAADHGVREFLAAFRFSHLLRLGLLGYATAYLWLTVPAFLFTMLDDLTSRWQILGFGIGCITLTLTLVWLPLLLAHVAAEGRTGAIFEIATVQKLAFRAPFVWAITTAILLACSILPLLYTALLKNTIPPHEFRWDLMLVFLVTVIPARVLVGWAYHRAAKRATSASRWPRRIWQWANTAALSGGIGWYVYFLYLAETGGELGQDAVWQFHALLLPWPF